MAKGYIERDSVLELIDTLLAKENEQGGINSASYAMKFLRAVVDSNINAVDAVKVVRCKDCKYWDGMNDDTDILCNNPLGLDYAAQPYDFCSYGERKDDDEAD